MVKNFFCKLKLAFFPCKKNKYRPRFLTSKFLLYYAVFLLLLKLVFIPVFFYFPKTVFFADITRTNLVEFANVARHHFGHQPLKENPTLNEAAYLKAKDMIEGGYFAHYSPEGVSPWYWLRMSGYNYRLAGENLAIGFLESEQVHQAWMNSLSHQKNILNPNYQEIGIAVLTGSFQGKETTLVVQYFGTPRAVILEQESLPFPELIKEESPEVPLALEKEPEKPEIEMPLEAGETIESEEKEDLVLEPKAGEEEPLLEAAPDFDPEETIVLAFKEESAKTPAFLLFRFITSSYYDFLQKIVYGSLILVIISLLATVYCDIFVYRKFEIDYKDIAFQAVGFSALWFILLYLDKLIILQIVAQNFRIN